MRAFLTFVCLRLIDVGAGDAIPLETPTSLDVLIEGGDGRAGGSPKENVVIPSLKQQVTDGTLAQVVWTPLDTDPLAGLIFALAAAHAAPRRAQEPS